jgi:hypothetical protein
MHKFIYSLVLLIGCNTPKQLKNPTNLSQFKGIVEVVQVVSLGESIVYYELKGDSCTLYLLSETTEKSGLSKFHYLKRGDKFLLNSVQKNDLVYKLKELNNFRGFGNSIVLKNVVEDKSFYISFSEEEFMHESDDIKGRYIADSLVVKSR